MDSAKLEAIEDGAAGALPRRWGMLGLLLLLAFVPRALFAWHWDLIWTDSITFLRASEALDRGDLQQAFAGSGLNIYPMLLWLLRRAGLDWTIAGQWWSVAMATLAVLPLFGWFRRQFGDDVAALACLLYAFHGKLVAVSALIIRDPTFWLLFCLTLYLAWRAVTEVRWWLFLAAGATLTLAVYTRTEGWLLVVPVVLWCAGRLPCAAGSRVRLAAGTALCLAMVPLATVLVNVTWLREAPQWGLLSPEHVRVFGRWLRPGGEAAQSDSEAAAAMPSGAAGPVASDAALRLALSRLVAGGPLSNDPMSPPPAGMSRWTMTQKVVVHLVKAYTYLYVLLGLVGWWGWRRLWLRREHQAVALMVVLLWVLIWIRFTQARTDPRYFLPGVIVSLPWMALGLQAVLAGIVGATQRRISWSAPRRRAPMTGLLVVVALIGSADIRLSSARFMESHAALGRWILETLGPNRTIAGNLCELRLVEYYGQGQAVGGLDPHGCVGEAVAAQVTDKRPDVVLLWQDPQEPDRWPAFAAALEKEASLGYRQVPQASLPPQCPDVLVLVRKPHRRK